MKTLVVPPRRAGTKKHQGQFRECVTSSVVTLQCVTRAFFPTTLLSRRHARRRWRDTNTESTTTTMNDDDDEDESESRLRIASGLTGEGSPT